MEAKELDNSFFKNNLFYYEIGTPFTPVYLRAPGGVYSWFENCLGDKEMLWGNMDQSWM